MANHKRKRPKNRRAGCLLCKLHKVNGAKRRRGLMRRSQRRALADEADQRRELLNG